MSPQAYYQARHRAQRRQAQEEMVLALFRTVRARHPRMEVRKIYTLIRPQLAAWGIPWGRDRLFALARAHGLLVPPRRSRPAPAPTGTLDLPNRLARWRPNRPGQALVADLTYLLTEVGHRFLFLLMDLAARFIVGWHLAASLSTDGALVALRRALEQWPPEPHPEPIHHSDHGVQYTSQAYQRALTEAGLVPSLGRVGVPQDNAHMERAIGVLKGEYGLEGPFPTEEVAYEAVAEAIHLYNHERPHGALGYKTPAEVYFMYQSVELPV